MKSIKIFLANNPLFLILITFFSWRFILFIFAKLTLNWLPLQQNFLGGGMHNYLISPLMWGYANFDGEHYIAIARNGYEPLTYFFFPIYPIIIQTFTGLIGESFYNFLLGSLIISNVSLFIGIFGLYKLLKIDYSNKISFLTVLLILIFPTSFYFVSAYNESMFFALVVWCFYLLRKKKWILAGILAAIASATRVIGIVMFLIVLVEIYQNYKLTNKITITQIISIIIAPLGVMFYMIFLQIETGDYLEFLHSVEIFGQQRSASLVPLSQVFYRYIFKIVPNINYAFWPSVYITFLELLTGLWLLISLGFSFIKLRFSYAIYLLLGFMIPTLSGSFSSLPRYLIVLFPAFLILAMGLNKYPKVITIIFIITSIIGLCITQTMFLRGYWVS